MGIVYLHLYIFLQLLILLRDPFEALDALARERDLPPVITFANSALKRIRHACSAGFLLSLQWCECSLSLSDQKLSVSLAVCEVGDENCKGVEGQGFEVKPALSKWQFVSESQRKFLAFSYDSLFLSTPFPTALNFVAYLNLQRSISLHAKGGQPIVLCVTDIR